MNSEPIGNSSAIAVESETTMTIFVFISSVMFILNLLSLITLNYCTRMIRQIRIFIMNIAFSDLLLGFSCLCFTVTSLVNGYKNLLCEITSFIARLTSVSSLLFCSCLAVDRCLTVFLSVRYWRLVTHRRTMFACICIWLFSSILVITCEPVSFPEFAMDEQACYHSFGYLIVYIHWPLILVASFVLIASYTCMIQRTYKAPSRTHGSQNVKINTLVRNFHSTVMVSVLVGFDIVFDFQVYVLLTIYAYAPTSIQLQNILLFTVFILKAVSGIANPLIYAWRLKEMQIRFLQMFCSRIESCHKAASDMNVEFTLGFKFTKQEETPIANEQEVTAFVIDSTEGNSIKDSVNTRF